MPVYVVTIFGKLTCFFFFFLSLINSNSCVFRVKFT